MPPISPSSRSPVCPDSRLCASRARAHDSPPCLPQRSDPGRSSSDRECGRELKELLLGRVEAALSPGRRVVVDKVGRAEAIDSINILLVDNLFVETPAMSFASVLMGTS